MLVKALSRLVPREWRPRDGYSVQRTLFWLVIACIVPASIVYVSWVYRHYEIERERVISDTVQIARARASRLDQMLVGLESGLWVLAQSRELEQGDLAAFHAKAQRALERQIATNYVLVAPGGRQLLNTQVAYGTPLPTLAGRPELAGIFSAPDAVLSDLFLGQVTRRFSVSMSVPVIRNGKTVYRLSAGVSPALFQQVFTRKPLPSGWVAGIIDSQGTIIARSADGERFTGVKVGAELLAAMRGAPEGSLETRTRDGVDVISSFSRSSRFGWTVAVGAPKQVLVDELYRSIALASLGSAALLGFGLMLAIGLSDRVVGAVHGLVGLAVALGRGEPVERYESWMKEANAVGTALHEASQRLLEAKHMAHHDALTGLANRMLFDELLAAQLLHAGRFGESIAILAVDLDGFKAVNDTEGHAAGDRVLRIAADRLRASIRSADVAARIGGDEFVVAASGDLDTARRIADKLIEALSQPYPDIVTRISASVGIALYPSSGSDAQTLMQRADEALYESKRHGKQRATVHEQLVGT